MTWPKNDKEKDKYKDKDKDKDQDDAEKYEESDLFLARMTLRMTWWGQTERDIIITR